jgi:type I restriction enzyme, S subunit
MTENIWQTASIGEVAKPIERAEEPLAGTLYRQIGVRLWGQGAYERESIDGSQTKYATLSKVESGDIIVNKIWARNGSVAVITDELAGCFGSSEFPTFVPDRNKLEPKWFHWMTKTRWFWEACDVKSQGTSGKNRIRPEKFLEIEIPLPPVMEQRRIVAHVESLARQVNEAQRLREEADMEANKLLDSGLIHLFENSNAPKKSLREVSHFQRGRFSWRPRNEPRFYDGDYPFIQIGDIPRDRKLITSYTQTLNDDGLKISRMFTAGTIVISIAATIGAVGILGFDSCMPDSLVGLNAKPEIAISDYLYYFLKYSQSHFEHIAPQSAQKNINIGILESVSLPVPPLDEQRRIVTYLDGLQAKVNALRELQSASGEELSALMPSILEKTFRGEL